MRLRELSPDEVSAWSDRRDSDRCPGCGGRDEHDDDCTEGIESEAEVQDEEEESAEFLRWAGPAPQFTSAQLAHLETRMLKARIREVLAGRMPAESLAPEVALYIPEINQAAAVAARR